MAHCSCNEERAVELSCLVCNALICFKCAFLYHQGHDSISLEQQGAIQRTKIKESISKLLEKFPDSSTNEYLESIPLEIEQTKVLLAKNIDTTIASLTSAICQRGIEAKSELEKFIAVKKERTCLLLHQLKSKNAQIHSILNVVNSLSDLQIMTSSKNIIDKLTKLSIEELSCPIAGINNEIYLESRVAEEMRKLVPRLLSVVDEASPDATLCTAERVMGGPKNTIQFRLALYNSQAEKIDDPGVYLHLIEFNVEEVFNSCS